MKTNKLNFNKTLSGLYFGQSIAITDQNLAFVSANNYSGGIVYAYKKYNTEWNWNELTKIISNNQEISHGFGFSISSNNNGDTLAISSPFENNNDGAVYIFTGNGTKWNQSYKISGNLNKSESFGYDLALNPQGNKLIIGTSINNSSTGKAYLYSGNANNWNLITGFTKNDGIFISNIEQPRYRTYYGNKVAIDSGNVVLIGSSFNNYSGAVFIYTGNDNTWIESQKLTGIGNVIYPLFGESFYITKNNNYILVGEPNSFQNNEISYGAVYIYQKNNNSWEFNNLITGNTDRLGKCLFINESGDFIFAAENSYSGSINNYIKTGNNWYKNLTIKNPNPNTDKYFANNFTTDLFYNKLLVGDSSYLYNQGTAYIFTKPWNSFQEYYGISDYYISGIDCYCDQNNSCSDCCGIVPSFQLVTGYLNNLNQFSAEISVTIQNNNCSPVYDVFRIYSNGIKIYNNIYNTQSLGGEYKETITLTNVKAINNYINLELKAYNLGQDYSYSSGININNY
jgi:hypothetical protein